MGLYCFLPRFLCIKSTDMYVVVGELLACATGYVILPKERFNTNSSTLFEAIPVRDFSDNATPGCRTVRRLLSFARLKSCTQVSLYLKYTAKSSILLPLAWMWVRKRMRYSVIRVPGLSKMCPLQGVPFAPRVVNGHIYKATRMVLEPMNLSITRVK